MEKKIHLEDIPKGSIIHYEFFPDIMLNRIYNTTTYKIKVFSFNDCKIWYHGESNCIKNQLLFNDLKIKKL